MTKETLKGKLRKNRNNFSLKPKWKQGLRNLEERNIYEKYYNVVNRKY